ncbi:MAG: hypothetical protein JRM74_00790 [Nitrososphaerota archaeon]|nr:hypothetical protein [Nitrososphaerota archaeon]MDG6937894.1 hypothetical protein [Nitrososphaerota archaeon]MDG6952968.1 hypothetical protein [Nitrososphaerota archaeon]MDG6959588.1 hypothetical protein [Nitrososphaerota archaeon]MDG6971802.1 hypothetical protein [Nitrososphaerota archaeon]
MSFDVAIFLAALGITTLELTEAAAVGLALYADSKSYAAFLYVALGTVVVLAPTVLAGAAIGLLPRVYVLLVGGVLLAYFGQRLVKSARRSVYFSRKGSTKTDTFEKGLLITGFSVGAIEAFEAAIVLVGLLPSGFNAAVGGLAVGVAIVVAATYILRTQVRKVKQAIMKVAVSSILLSFAVLWFGELIWDVFSLGELSDLVLIPLFVFWFAVVYKFANRPFPELEGSLAGAVRPDMSP